MSRCRGSREWIDGRGRQYSDHLRSVLKAHNLTVSGAARVCHASRSTFARRLASGNVLVEWLFYLADEFDMSPSELVPESAAV